MKKKSGSAERLPWKGPQDCLVCLLMQDGIKVQADAGRTYPKRSLMIVTSHLL